MGALRDLLEHGYLDANPVLAGVVIGAAVLLMLILVVRRIAHRSRTPR